jgi:Domain of unknown function (DUF6436)
MSSESPATRTRRKALPWIALTAWLVATAYALWAFELSHQRPFETKRAALFDASARARAAETWYRASVAPLASSSPAASAARRLRASSPVSATLVHIYSAGCPCNRFTDEHLQRLLARYRLKVRFVAAERPPVQTEPESLSRHLPRVTLPAGAEFGWIDAVPAALVYDATGKLVYFGPYSDSARCGEPGSGELVERVLDQLLSGHAPRPQPFYGAGCFCETPSSSELRKLPWHA